MIQRLILRFDFCRDLLESFPRYQPENELHMPTKRLLAELRWTFYFTGFLLLHAAGTAPNIRTYADASRSTKRIDAGPVLTTRVLWPRPVVSTSGTRVPGGKRRVSPSVVVISLSPAKRDAVLSARRRVPRAVPPGRQDRKLGDRSRAGRSEIQRWVAGNERYRHKLYLDIFEPRPALRRTACPRVRLRRTATLAEWRSIHVGVHSAAEAEPLRCVLRPESPVVWPRNACIAALVPGARF